jgi:hypothetical protein
LLFFFKFHLISGSHPCLSFSVFFSHPLFLLLILSPTRSVRDLVQPVHNKTRKRVVKLIEFQELFVEDILSQLTSPHSPSVLVQYHIASFSRVKGQQLYCSSLLFYYTKSKHFCFFNYNSIATDHSHPEKIPHFSFLLSFL